MTQVSDNPSPEVKQPARKRAKIPFVVVPPGSLQAQTPKAKKVKSKPPAPGLSKVNTPTPSTEAPPSSPGPARVPAPPKSSLQQNNLPPGVPPPPPGYFYKYGKYFPDRYSKLEVELAAFRLGITVEKGGLGKERHFINIVDMLWNRPGSPKTFAWHPWALDMLKAACERKYLAVAGCANSGKSDFFALWAIVNFICAPEKTLVLVTSTTLKESKKRIWGALVEYWNAVPGLPGRVVDTLGMIRLDDGSGKKFSDKCGIALVPAEKKQEKDAVGKLIGMKNDRVFLIIDEMPEISEAVLQAGISNLAQNLNFQLIGLGNPASHFDAFGILCTPKSGNWDDISSVDDEWETQLGYALRFDALKSPNVLAEETIYPFLPTKEKISAAAHDLGGEQTVGFWRMLRGFWCPTGSEDNVYSEADIIKFGANKGVIWQGIPRPVAALDPAYTNGGDRTVLYYGKVGLDTDNVLTLWFDRFEILAEDAANKDEPRSFQIAKLFREKCLAYGVAPRDAAFDASGAGGPFGDIVATVWSPDVLRVNFGGSASELPVSLSDKTPSNERYTNRVTEIWFSGKELMRTGQIRGIGPDAVLEMCARKFETRKKGGNLCVEVESKRDMKLSIKKSPDIADAAFILVDLCRQRLGFTAKNIRGGEVPGRGGTQTWMQRFRRLNASAGGVRRLRVA